MGSKQKITTINVRVCDICEVEEGSKHPKSQNHIYIDRCSHCGKEICGDCIATYTEDEKICKSPGCEKAADVVAEWGDCKKSGDPPEGEVSLICELCKDADTCENSYVKYPEFQKIWRYA